MVLYFLTWVTVSWVNLLSSAFLLCILLFHRHTRKKRLNKVLHYKIIIMQGGEAVGVTKVTVFSHVSDRPRPVVSVEFDSERRCVAEGKLEWEGNSSTIKRRVGYSSSSPINVFCRKQVFIVGWALFIILHQK